MPNRLPHANGVTWVFHDPVTGFVHHVNVPNIPPVAQQQHNQRSAQSSHSNEMVLYQSPSNQVTQQVAWTASAAQPMATPSAQSASVASCVPVGAGSRRCFQGGHHPRESNVARVLRPKGVVEDASQQVQGHEDSIFPCACRCRVTEMLPGRTPSKGEGCCPSTRPKGVVGDASQRVQGLEDSINFSCTCQSGGHGDASRGGDTV